VYFGVIIEITMDLFRCFAHGFRTGDITVRWEDLPLFVLCMCFVIGFLAVGWFVQEKLKIDCTAIHRSGKPVDRRDAARLDRPETRKRAVCPQVFLPACNRDQRTGSVMDKATGICGAVVPSK
jgi:hypothetical protein